MKISVVGSSGIDMVIKTYKIPVKGETVLGEDIMYTFGGKGANQAVACSRLGCEVAMFGAIGDDDNGKKILENFKNNNVRTKYMKIEKDTKTGLAIIYIAENDNSIVVVPSANSKVDIPYIDSIKNEILKSDIVIMQFEIPVQTVDYVAKLCNENNIKVILNPAPARKISSETLNNISYITPNETEFEFLCSDDMKNMTFEEKVKKMSEQYNVNVIVTQGEKGVYAIIDGETIKVDALKVKEVDTTGAGDTFNGAFAYAIANKYPMKEALKFASKCASISITKLGAQGGMPTINDLNNL